MPYFELKYSSKALSRNVTVSVILPNPEKGEELRVPERYKTLYLLHGLAGDHTAWVRNTSIERYAADYGIAVVMPSVERSWYTNTAYGQRYLDFVADELPAVCRGYFKRVYRIYAHTEDVGRDPLDEIALHEADSLRIRLLVGS